MMDSVDDPELPPLRINDVRDDLPAASDASLVLALARYQQAALAEVYRRHAGAVFGLAKRVLDASARPALSTTLELEVALQEICARSEDFAEGARAFKERRQPEFSGR